MSRRLLSAALAALLLLLGLTSAAQAASPRIVALTPFTANVLAQLSVTPVAVGETLGGGDRFIKSLDEVPRLTLSHPLGPNMEELAVLNPQLVLSAPIWTKGNQSMKGLGIRVVESDPQRVDDVPRQTEFIGQIVGRRAEAKKRADEQRRSIKVAKSRIRSRPTVLLLLGIGRSVQAFMPDSWGGDLVKQAGGRLLTEGLKGTGGFASLSNEVVALRNPDIIIVVPHGVPSNLKRTGEYLASNPAWKNTKAVKNKRIYISSDNTLLQAWPYAAQSIADVQKRYLRNAGR